MRKQSGQSLVVGLIFLPVIVLFLLYLYNVSQQNLHKTRLQNTSDAAVLSGSQFLARELNFKAYTNRAMIANHVAIGQYVGLSSWFNFAVETFDNIEDVARFIPGVGAYFTQAEQYIDSINDTVLQPGLEVAVTLTNAVNTGLSKSQSIMSYASSAAMVDSLNGIVKLNDADAELDIISATTLMNTIFNDWRDYQGGFNRTDNTGRYQEFFKVVTNSRDQFLVNRSHDWGFPFSFTWPWCTGYYKTRQAGGTDLINHGERDKETWTSMDTLSIHYKRWKRFRCRKREARIGWGGSHAGEDNDTRRYSSRSLYGQSRRINRSASNRAYARESAMNDAYSGIQQFYSVKKIDQSNDAPPVTIVVSKSIDALQTSKSLGIGTTKENETRNVDINIEEGMDVPRDQFSSAAKARIYYYRATDLWPNTRFEYGNLYNPYWQTSLQDIENSERTYLLGAVFGLDLAGM
ncbi:MAG: Tad domain-containing protein [Pseudomonadota bacterium]|nr:Tad domain-containing protein [Pseudomonadota bacterium]